LLYTYCNLLHFHTDASKMTTATVLTVLAGIVGIVALGIYFFGIPPEIKREMERKALKTMGENKMSYMVKGMPTDYNVLGAY
jgi:hypothetical protein